MSEDRLVRPGTREDVESSCGPILMSGSLLRSLYQEQTIVVMKAKENLAFDTMKPSDQEFALEAFREWKLDCHGFQNNKAWRVMAELACSPTSHLETVAVRDGDRVVAFLIMVTQPGEFWPLFLSRLGPGTLLSKMANSFVQTARKTFSGDRRNERLPAGPDEPVDEEFAQLTERPHKTTQSVAWGLFSFVDPDYRKPTTAFLMYRRMFQQLQDKGFKRLEGQIRFGNKGGVTFHRALGFDIRNAGSCFHAVKHLEPGE